ncbi:MAG: DNA-directed RNA polymerase subunit N [Candidatus Diapherotrites archaeon]|uniref:DNA-directed RNA polymerase subunit Rpo10 n=1 Tax=Candidatus Iainarchaeum sp. TaxID=3101447 RepID=A0A2D6M0N5_9ARCH|nr:DNA-directed RNA polymerase subunit N [Candidatus Diapherotrites archaeon]|tara:strand:- start:10036 stop:10230 length:195 start_codon:yes stop_codon:yes gene_type:complete
MMVPVRCFSCGKVIGSIYEAFEEKVKKGENPEKALDELGVKRYCCRRMVFTQADLIDDIMKYQR